MKAKIVVLLLLASFGLSLAADIRVVNGAPVDLDPLHEWSARKKGGRPLKHWKEIQVLDIEQIGGVSHYSVQIDGRNTEVFIDHLPARITRHFEQIRNLDRQADALREYIQQESLRIKNLNATAKTSASKSDQPRKALTSIKADIKVAKNALDQKKDELAKISKELSGLKKGQDDLTEFAMFTGRKYAGLDIWDCGKKE